MEIAETTHHRFAWDGKDFVPLIRLEPLGNGRFINSVNEDNRNGRIFGGQLIAQAFQAAAQSVERGRIASSLHVRFLQGGLSSQQIEYEVTPLQDGKRFSSRRISATQGDRTIIEAQASFNHAATGITHSVPAPVVFQPEELKSVMQLHDAHGPENMGDDLHRLAKPHLELRVVRPEEHLLGTSPSPHLRYWVRLHSDLDDDPATHLAALAYLSDYWINSAAITHHVPARDAFAQFYVASLNHSLWLHRQCRADDWLLFDCESPNANDGRALTLGRIYARNGDLVASVAQEGMVVDRADFGG